MKKPKRYPFLSWMIEKGCMGWYVLDWDYETPPEAERIVYQCRTEKQAQEFCVNQMC